MHKLSVLKSTFASILVFLVIGPFALIQAQEGTLPQRIMITPLESGHTGVAITWRNPGTETDQYIQWSEAHDYPVKVEAEANTDRALKSSPHQKKKALNQKDTVLYNGETSVFQSCRVSLTDLIPGETYMYRVGNDVGGWSEWIQFDLPSKDPNALFSFIYMGDPQSDLRSQWSRTIRQAFRSAPNSSFILYAGDLVNRGNNDQEWGELYQAGDFIHRMIPSIVTPGNHDYEYPMLSPLWNSHFTLPLNGPSGYKELAGACYYVDYPAVRVISLDGTTSEKDPRLRKVQARWLEEVLKKTDQKWIILTLHQPFYSTKASRDNPQIRDAFQHLVEKYGVDLILQGHDHAYGRGMLSAGGQKPGNEGVMYVVSVSGPKQYEVDSTKSWMQRMGSDTQLYQVIDIENDQLNYRCYTTTGTLFDSFTLKKRGQRQIELIDEF